MIADFIRALFHIDQYLKEFIQSFGVLVYVLLFAIIFVETGLVIMPFLPGDSLLFVAGTFAGAGSLNIYWLIALLSIAAILGDTANYWLGKYFGEKVFSRFIRKDYMEKTKKFYHKHGKKTIVIARFIPIIRTFAPFVAGVGKMNYISFLSYNIIGGISWVLLFCLGGYFFGGVPLVKENLTITVIIIIVVSMIPAVVEYIKHKRSIRKK